MQSLAPELHLMIAGGLQHSDLAALSLVSKTLGKISADLMFPILHIPADQVQALAGALDHRIPAEKVRVLSIHDKAKTLLKGHKATK